MSARLVRRARVPKRIAYVSDEEDSSNTEEGYSSENESVIAEDSSKHTKSSSHSIRNLMKQSQCYVKGDEHAYTQCSQGKKRIRIDVTTNVASSKKRKCESKNAVNARLNRERKKAYVTSLEAELEDVRATNKDDARVISAQNVAIEGLRREVTQLKCLIANNRYLGALVSKLSSATGLPVRSSLLPRQEFDEESKPLQPRTRSVPTGFNHPIARCDVNLNSGDLYINSELTNDNDLLFPDLNSDGLLDFDPNELLPFGSSESLVSDLDQNIGICVHINQNHLSVEFCSVCNAKAWST